MKRGVLMWLVVALVALVVFVLVDFSRYSRKVPTDQEIDQVGEDSGQDNLTIEGNVEEEIPEFIE